MIKFITMLNKHSKLVNVFIFSLIGLFTWLIYLATCWGLADLLTKPASYRLSLWEQEGLNTESAWQNTLIQLNLAIDLEPKHPDLLELISRAYYLHANNMP